MLRTARLDVRPITADDVAAVEAVYGDPATMSTMPWRLLPTRSAAEAWLQARLVERAATSHGLFVVTDRGGTLIGLCGFMPRADELEVGWVVRKDHWGQGFATEAVAAIVSAAGDCEIFAAIRPSNLASIRVAEKIGLRFDREDDDEFGRLVVYRNVSD